jgi:hypothetical protein
MTELARTSFELNEEMLHLIGREFDLGEIVGRFARAISGKEPEEIESIGREIFNDYGVALIKRSLQLGEQYPDRTYEVLRQAIDVIGGELWFPLVPQRFLEIAYLSTQDMEFLPVIENNPQRLVYRVPDCRMFATTREMCGEKVGNMLPCRHACLSTCRTLFHKLGYPEVRIEMTAGANKGGYCQFNITRI